MKIAFVLLASLVAAEDCVDSAEETTDSGGDGCSWYENNRSQCGWWDTSAFTASTMCCSCENPHPAADDCVDNTDKEDAGGGGGVISYDPIRKFGVTVRVVDYRPR